MGICMSHAGYLLRATVSATFFTIVGILCKVLTVIINCMLWEKHATPQGIGFLFLCILGGTFYQQAPMRAAASVEIVKAKPDPAVQAPGPKKEVESSDRK
eukprot:gene30078-35043_t